MRHALSGWFYKSYEMYIFSGTIREIDGTNIAIVASPKNHVVLYERDFFNYKRYHSINMQVVTACDVIIFYFEATSFNYFLEICIVTHYLLNDILVAMSSLESS